jgi:DNA-binding transcriptional LysR family regulator
MQLRHLKAFMAVADTLNFTRAAERIHLAQSSVTEQIQALEADLGVRLFDRTHRKLALTPEGRCLLVYAGELTGLADEARAAVARTSAVISGPLVIGGLETLCSTHLPELIATFGRRYPTVNIALRTADSNSLRNGLGNGELDVAFVFGNPPTAQEIRCEVIGQEELVVILPSGHRLAEQAEIGPDDLPGEAFVVTQPGCVYRKIFDEAFAATLPHQPRQVGELASLGAIRGLVEAGHGCALVPTSAVTTPSARLAAIPWAGGERTTPITMMWRRRRVLSSATDAFLAAARIAFALRPGVARHRRERPSRR